MKKIIVSLLLMLFMLHVPTMAEAQRGKSSKPKTVYVKGYTTKKGKTVRPYYRSKPSKRTHSFYLYQGPEFFLNRFYLA